MFKPWLMILLSPLAFANEPSHQTTPNHPVATQQAAGIWIDVRTPAEFQEAHLENAINIPHDQIAEHIAHITTNKNEPIHLYCRSGRRAESALQTLKNLGYTNVINHGSYEEVIETQKSTQ